ncbi:MAG: D-glucuronyl C5-epimerase family protein, partial [Actinomycetes bacterium]
WNHPSAQAQYGIAMLESHRLTGDVRYLQIALRQAVRLAGRARPYGGALFHPYDFPVAPHHTAVRTAPWYSAIAQGQVLDFFSRLAAVTGSASHGTTAAGTFASFLVPQVAGRPWVAWVQGGHLWLDEYPRCDIALGDRTYNGHSFASFGIYQYFLRTGDERARQLVQGAFSTTRAVAPQIRNAGWRSAYCLADRADANRYHPTHTLQNLLIATITGDASFAAVADLFDADFPDPVVTGTVLIQPGTYRAYVFDADGGVPASRLLVAPKLTSAPCSARTKIVNRTGIWYLISAGTAAGYYLPERRGSCTCAGPTCPCPTCPTARGD